MSNVTAEVPTVDQLLEIWGGDPAYRVIPAFAESHEIADAEAVLRVLLNDDLATFTHYDRDAGVRQLRYMAAVDARCADFTGAADLLETNPPSVLLVLGWSIR